MFAKGKKKPESAPKEASRSSTSSTATGDSSRGVTFHTKLRVIKPKEAFYLDDLENYFYSDDEIAEMSEQRHKTLDNYLTRRKMGVKWDEQSGNETIRGLEDQIEDATNRNTAREEHVRRLLDEVRNQKVKAFTKGEKKVTYDMEAFRKASVKASKVSQKCANKIGDADANEVYTKPRRSKTGNSLFSFFG